MIDRPSIEASAYTEFIRNFDFKGPLRLGQAFYDHFNLHKMEQTREISAIYQLDGGKAIHHILQTFDFH